MQKERMPRFFPLWPWSDSESMKPLCCRFVPGDPD